VAVVQELNSESRALWRTNELALVVVDVEVLTGINQRKVLRSLHYQVHHVFQVKHKWS
jgi:hypothetical protein